MRVWRFTGQIHGFLSLGATLPQVQQAKEGIASFVGAVFDDPSVLTDEGVGLPEGAVER